MAETRDSDGISAAFKWRWRRRGRRRTGEVGGGGKYGAISGPA